MKTIVAFYNLKVGGWMIQKPNVFGENTNTFVCYIYTAHLAIGIYFVHEECQKYSYFHFLQNLQSQM